jgi:hypothetical protein
MLKSVSLEESERHKSTLTTNMLTWTDHRIQPLRSILPLVVKPLSDDDKVPPEVDAKRMESLKEIDLDKDPYYITRLKCQLGELHPCIFILGHIGIPKDQEGNIPVEFGQELFEANDLALLDYGADCCVICTDFIGVKLNERTRVFFDFEDIFDSLLLLKF